jgi:iron complex outermembrane receptor protein
MYNYIYPTNTGETGPQGGRPKFQFVGRDAVLTGAEAALEVSFTSALVLEGHLSYVRGALAQPPDSLPATDTEPAREGARYLPLIPPLNGSIGLRYETPAAFAALGARLAGRQERLGDFEAETPGYASLHASTGVRVQLGERLHTITLRVENIADAEYRDHLSRIKSIMPEAGRSFSLLYRVTF